MSIIRDWLDSSTESDFFANTCALAGGIAASIAASIGVYYLFSSTSDESVQAGTELGPTTASLQESGNDSIMGSGASISEEPLEATVSVALVGTGVASTYTSYEEPDIIIHVFKRNNQMPYSRIERNAQRIFDTYHRKKNFRMNFPVVIASSKESMNYADKLFSCESVADSLENIEVIERLINKSVND